MNNNRKYKEYKSRLKFILFIILVALLISLELYFSKNYSIIIWIVILSCLVISIIYILFQNYRIRNKAHTKSIKKWESLQYENSLSHYFDFFEKRLVNDWKNYRIVMCCIIIFILLLSFEPILFFTKYTYEVAEWISGIGSLSAAIVALFAVMYKPKPHIGDLKYSDPKHNTIIIQFFNTSKTPDFIRLKSIYMSNENTSKEIPLYAEFNKMLIFNMVNINTYCTFVITNQSRLSFDRHTKVVLTEILDKFEHSEYTNLIFNFTNIKRTYNKSVHFILGKDLIQK